MWPNGTGKNNEMDSLSNVYDVWKMCMIKKYVLVIHYWTQTNPNTEQEYDTIKMDI